MPSADIVKSVNINRTPRVMQLEGIFDIPPSKKASEKWGVNIPFSKKKWNVGLIVGPSGCGKTIIINELFKDYIYNSFDWLPNNAVVDNYPKGMGIKDVSKLLNSVGFSSPPSWLKPFRVLSNGEKFRCHVARAMAESKDFFVIDEFSSVVDRTVAKIGSVAIAKTVRKYDKQFIAATCHYDIEEWLQPDWVYKPVGNEFKWRLLQHHPKINLEVRKVHTDAWEYFRKHHYLSQVVNKSAQCFVSFVEGVPASFFGYIHLVNNVLKNTKKGHRNVCMPDYQGVGIGSRLEDYIASCLRLSGYDYIAQSSHPARIHYCANSKDWKLINKTKVNVNKIGKSRGKGGTPSGGSGNYQQYLGRVLYTFRYLGCSPGVTIEDAKILDSNATMAVKQKKVRRTIALN